MTVFGLKICLIAEGCYPYVTGGVSAWIQMLVKSMPDLEFVIFTIGANRQLQGNYKYDIPPNVIEIRETFLDAYMNRAVVNGDGYRLTNLEKQNFANLLLGDRVAWESIFSIIRHNKNLDPIALLSSRDYFRIVERICEKRYKTAPFSDMFWTVRSVMLTLLTLIKTDAPDADIYHCASAGYAGIMGVYFKYRTGKPLILSEHGIYSRERDEEILKADWIDVRFKQLWSDYYKNLSHGAYQNADLITSLFSKARDMQIELGAPEEKCVVIPNGIDIELFSRVSRCDFDDKTRFNVGAVVRVVPIKDIKTLILSFNILKKEIPNARLYIIGPVDEDLEYYNECLALVEDLSCPDVIFTGRVKTAEILEKIDVVLLTSISEGQPFVLLEAMAARRPVVSTDVGGCREVVEGNDDGIGPAGIVVPMMNVSRIAEALQYLASNRAQMRAMAENGFQRVKRFYYHDYFLSKYREIYDSFARNEF